MVQRREGGEKSFEQQHLPFHFFFYLYLTTFFQITATDELCIVKDGNFRKLIIKKCKEEDAGKYRCEADGRKTEALVKVEGTLQS